MAETAQSDLDLRVRALHEAGELKQAATAIIEMLGPHVVRVIHARFRDEDATAEVFARFAESMWVALPQFAFRCSVRAWVFTLARNAGSRYLEREVRRARAAVTFSRIPELAAGVDGVRASTLAHLRSSNHDRLAHIRQELSEEDQLLLTLRIDQRLKFEEIAQVTLGTPDCDPGALRTEAARLRKRLQLIKERLRSLLRSEHP